MANSGVIGALRGVLGLDTREWEAGWKRAAKTATETNIGKGILDGLKGAVEGLKEIASGAGLAGKSLGAMGGAGLAAAVGIGAVIEGLKKTGDAIEVAASFGKLATILGTTTDFVQKFNFAARQSDVDVGGADEALKGLNTTFGAVASGLARSQTVKAFAAVGFTPEQLHQFHDVGDFFPVLVERIAAIGNAAEQAAIAKRMGISELLPLLRAGASNFNTLAKAAEDLGIVMDASLVKQAEEAKKKLAEISDVTKAQANITFAEFADTLVSIKEKFADAERAGLKFLAAITGTTPLDARIATLQAYQTHLALSSVKGAGDPDNAADLAKVTSELNALRLKQTILATVGPGAEKPGGPPPSTLVPGKTRDPSKVAEASEQALAASQKAELQAQIALTSNIARLATLRAQEVDTETKAANDKLAEQAHQGHITKDAADAAILANNRTAVDRKAKITRDALFASQNAELDHRGAIERYTQEAAQIEAGLAHNATQRAAIENRALADRQRLEQDQLRAEAAEKTASDATLKGHYEALTADQAVTQAAQRDALERKHAGDIQAEANAAAEAALELQIEILQAQANAAETDGERRDIQLSLLKLEQQLEKLKLEEVVASKTATDGEKQRAAAILASLPGIQADQTKAAVGSLFDAFGRAESGVSGLANAFKSHDWAHVAQGLVSTIAGLQQAFGANGTIGGKIGAAAGVGSAVGSAVGGVAGSTISGIAGGASLGFSVGGPVGAAIGAVIGGIAGFLGGSSADKKAKQQAAQQAADEAAAHALSVSNEARTLQIQLLQSEGKSEEATALQRQAAIASVNAENAALEGQLFDLNLAAEKAAAAAQVAAQGHDLQIQLMEALGDSTGALAARRADELAALDASNRGLQAEIYNLQDYATAKAAAAQAEQDAAAVTSKGQQDLSAARDREAAAYNDTISKFQAVADNLKQVQAGLDQAAPTSASNYAGASAAFARTAALAQLGNLDAAGSLQTVEAQFLAQSKANASTALEYARDVAKVKTANQAAIETATRQVSIAKQQLDALNEEVDALLKVNDSVLSVADAIAALGADIAAQASASAEAFAAALARLAPAEGVNLVPLSPLPAGGTALLAASTSPTVDASSVDSSVLAPGLAAAIADSVADQINPALAQVVTYTRRTAEFQQQFADIGIPTVAAA